MNKDDFDVFRKEIHSTIRGNYQDEAYNSYISESNTIKLPGKIEIEGSSLTLNPFIKYNNNQQNTNNQSRKIGQGS